MYGVSPKPVFEIQFTKVVPGSHSEFIVGPIAADQHTETSLIIMWESLPLLLTCWQ